MAGEGVELGAGHYNCQGERAIRGQRRMQTHTIQFALLKKFGKFGTVDGPFSCRGGFAHCCMHMRIQTSVQCGGGWRALRGGGGKLRR